MKKELYEGMYILSATLSDDARAKAIDKISKGIKDRGGEVHKVHDQGRKKIAYEIRGTREGHYFLLFFTAPTSALAELWKEYHLNEDLLRFLTMKTDEVKEKIEFKQLPE
ncbi:MAG: 30S ribosomal protein S6 [Chlamydiales bacterium]|nr:30S ribosomal protein S6 [Chlamydiales bacterium]MCH9619220.1 30S ribosomal protein S6 [Chlamydiales bacterium]MCH9622482.1 30S ribosomal protein S6 [Chlamydiales bacterium]